jgi:hypothetical protein
MLLLGLAIGFILGGLFTFFLFVWATVKAKEIAQKTKPKQPGQALHGKNGSYIFGPINYN